VTQKSQESGAEKATALSPKVPALDLGRERAAVRPPLYASILMTPWLPKLGRSGRREIWTLEDFLAIFVDFRPT